MSSDFWNIITAETYISGAVTVQKGDEIPHISESGIFVSSIGEPRGQTADWRTHKTHIDSGIHAVEYRDRYELHVDLYDPHYHPIKHLVFDLGPGKLALLVTAGTILRKIKGK